MATIKLENWAVVSVTDDAFAPPNAFRQQLQGELASEHTINSLLKPGTTVLTSNIIYLRLDEMRAATQSGTIYELGEPNYEWIDWLMYTGKSLKDFER